ncbi:MAG: protein kinase [Polyangia bacterium]
MRTPASPSPKPARTLHRDLKPDNVFVVPRSTNPEFVKVLDFGVAKLRGDPTATDDKLTSTGMIIGTAPYMSPEQWHSKPDVDGRADIYALGVILFESHHAVENVTNSVPQGDATACTSRGIRWGTGLGGVTEAALRHACCALSLSAAASASGCRQRASS